MTPFAERSAICTNTKTRNPALFAFIAAMAHVAVATDAPVVFPPAPGEDCADAL